MPAGTPASNAVAISTALRETAILSALLPVAGDPA
jgi:hypothetical protein